MVQIMLVAIGGGLGAVGRYFLQAWGQALTPGVFPIGTLLVNVLGCLIVGFLGHALTSTVLIRPEYRIGLMIGLLGGFTTFSAYGWETIALLDSGEMRLALLNVALSNVLGLSAAWFGYRIAERLYGA